MPPSTPALVAGDGATVGLAAQEAENAPTAGTVIGPDPAAYTLPAEASGRTAPFDVAVNGGHRATMTLTSQYAWLYNRYPFTNDPDAGLLHPDRWITECSRVPGDTTLAGAFDRAIAAARRGHPEVWPAGPAGLAGALRG